MIKNVNLKLAIRVENLILLHVFYKGIIFHYFLIAFCIKKGKKR